MNNPEPIDLRVVYRLAAANSDMTDIERLTNLFAFASRTLESNVEGDVVEIGCNRGYTSVFLQQIIASQSLLPRTLHVYDSFEGLPEAGPDDQYLSDVDLSVSVDDLKRVFRQFDTHLPCIHKGWFADTLPKELPRSIAFAYLDGDYYESTLQSLKTVVPRLSAGGVAIVDDYADLELAPRAWDGLPGVKRACDEYFATSSLSVQPLVGSGDLSFGLIRRPWEKRLEYSGRK